MKHRLLYTIIVVLAVSLLLVFCSRTERGIKPVAVISYTLLDEYAPARVQFDSTESYDQDGSIVNVEWDLGDGETTGGDTPEHEYALAGTYTVSLTVTDNQNLSDTTSVEVVIDKGLVWTAGVDKPIYYSTPAIGSDGTIYVGTGVYLHTNQGTLYAINPDGTIKWSQALDLVTAGSGQYMDNAYSPAIGIDGTIYVQGSSGALYAFDTEGHRLWRFASFDNYPVFNEVGQRTPAIANSDTLYLGADALYALNSTGAVLWRFPPSPTNYGSCNASPVIAPDGTIYVMMAQDQLFAVNPDGSQKWLFRLDNDWEMSFSSPTVDAQGNVYIGAEGYGGSYVYAVDANGNKLWRYVIPGEGREPRASPAIGPDGTLYVATKAGYDSATQTYYNGLLIAFDRSNGAVKWTYEVQTVHVTPDDVYASPAIGADGTVYFGAETGRLYAVDADSGTLKWSIQLSGGINWSSPTLLPNGMLYIGSHNTSTEQEWEGTLNAIQTGTSGLAISDWPTFRHDNLNSGDYNH